MLFIVHNPVNLLIVFPSNYLFSVHHNPAHFFFFFYLVPTELNCFSGCNASKSHKGEIYLSQTLKFYKGILYYEVFVFLKRGDCSEITVLLL